MHVGVVKPEAGLLVSLARYRSRETHVYEMKG